jgi:hypothetical protein
VWFSLGFWWPTNYNLLFPAFFAFLHSAFTNAGNRALAADKDLPSLVAALPRYASALVLMRSSG